jgi:hypothetical protein
MDWEYIPVPNHVKCLSNGEFACLRVGYDILVYPSIIWSGECHSYSYVWFYGAYFPSYGDRLVYVNVGFAYVCGYVRT